MSYPLELFIGLRYLRAKKRNHFISFISSISIFGIALAIILLITVLSVMNGFQQELRDRILVMTSHITVSATHGGLQDWQKVSEALVADKDIRGSAPFVRGEVMLSHAGNVHAALIRGIVPEHEPSVSAVADKMKDAALADLKPGEFGIILGHELARSLGVWPGDKITVVSPQLNVSPAGVMPRLKRFTLLGTFEVGMHEFDSGLALMHVEDAARLMRMKGEVSGVRLKIDKLFDAPQKRYEIAQQLGAGYYVSDWTRRHANFFRAVKMEKTVMFVILSLIIAVAAFNIVSTLVMVVTDKESDIAILRTLGLSPASIMQVFMVQGTVIGLLGTLIGMLGGVMLASNVESIVQFIERQFETRFLDPSIYYISVLPSQILWSDVLLVCGVSFAVSMVATLYPALRASKTHPVEALRYE
ncbi:MAG: lipoprotein-releasing ABC transporter permease subunit [Gammaproteobacteria bacterium]|nr:lipoprotein-releasing ABC transporter permease subunit [Gammaproteobacteria bacterium]